jgi:hypothetical protein
MRNGSRVCRKSKWQKVGGSSECGVQVMSGGLVDWEMMQARLPVRSAGACYEEWLHGLHEASGEIIM